MLVVLVVVILYAHIYTCHPLRSDWVLPVFVVDPASLRMCRMFNMPLSCIHPDAGRCRHVSTIFLASCDRVYVVLQFIKTTSWLCHITVLDAPAFVNGKVQVCTSFPLQTPSVCSDRSVATSSSVYGGNPVHHLQTVTTGGISCSVSMITRVYLIFAHLPCLQAKQFCSH